MYLKAPTDAEIRQVLLDPEIWDREADDLSPPPEQFSGLPGVSCLGGYVEGRIIGIAGTHKTPVGTKFHFAVLKPHRRRARAFLALVLDWMDSPIYCDIPDCYRAVINFAKHAGFIETGKNGAYMKNGISHQRTRLCRS